MESKKKRKQRSIGSGRRENDEKKTLGFVHCNAFSRLQTVDDIVSARRYPKENLPVEVDWTETQMRLSRLRVRIDNQGEKRFCFSTNEFGEYIVTILDDVDRSQ